MNMDAGWAGWPRTNEESWQRTREFVAYLGGHPAWPAWVRVAESILDALERDGLDRALRIGTSMHDIIFSTLDHHDLRDEPRTTLRIDLDGAHVRISHARVNVEFAEPDEEVRVPSAQAIPIIRQYLEKLWRETKPDEALPPGLAGAGVPASTATG